jgi:hypothetical protein
LVQVSVVNAGVIVTPAGGVTFCVIAIEVLAVQPLAGFVTVIVYVPALNTFTAEEVAVKLLGPLQL